MAIDLRQEIKLAQQLVLTPQLQQAIKLLQLSRIELVTMIKEEMEQNPMLEEEELEEKSEENLDAEVEMLLSTRLEEGFRSQRGEYEEVEPVRFENFLAKKTSLAEHLMWQLKLSNFSKEEEKIGEFIIGNIDKEGYLRINIDEIAKICNVSTKKVEEVLKKIQNFDPVGVGSRDLKECLLVQLEMIKKEQDCNGKVEIAKRIVRNHLKDLEEKKLEKISKSLGVSIGEVERAARLISTLDPKPGYAYSDEDTIYVVPDVFVEKVGDDFSVFLNTDGLPKLRINPLYYKLLCEDTSLDKNAKDYMKDKLKQAVWLIKSIYKRQETILKVARSIVKFQKDFFEKGPSHLKPLVLKDVAQDIGMHESTVSRVTTNKYMYTPHGIFELKYFFTSSIKKGDGDDLGAESVKEKIKQIIASEDPKSPLSDREIALILKKENINIARRTVTKYREAMGILPSSKRRRL